MKNIFNRQMIKNIDIQKFIIAHADDDVNFLALHKNKFPQIDMDFVLRQIEGRQKVKHKLPTFYNNINVLYPPKLSLEQSSSEITARYKSTFCKGKTLIDLTAGFGADAFFMSEKFEKTVCIESNAELCEILQHNYLLCNKFNISIIHSSAENFLHNCSSFCDFMYIDPARRKKSGQKSLLLADCQPNIEILLPEILPKTQKLLIKLSPMFDIQETIRKTGEQISEIHIVAVENECKELLILIENKISLQENQNIKIITKNFLKNSIQTFEFQLDEERKTNCIFSKHIKKYLYEPNSALMKSGAYNLVAKRFNLEKLHKNTHLYFSDKIVENFCGKIFAVKKTWGNSAKMWNVQAKQLQKANIAVRNFPLSASELRAKLHIADGGNIFLFGCTLANGEKMILECEKF